MSSETPCVHETLTHTDGALATWAGLKIDRKISPSNFHGSAAWIQIILGPGAAKRIQPSSWILVTTIVSLVSLFTVP